MDHGELPSLHASDEGAISVTTVQQATNQLCVWIAEDDVDDHLLFSLAAAEAELCLDLMFSLNGLDMIESLAKTPAESLPDLVLLDLRMPGLDGHRTLELIRSDPKTADMPVVVFTTSTREADRVSALGAGANFVVVKPIQFSEMVEFADSLAWRAAVATEPVAT